MRSLFSLLPIARRHPFNWSGLSGGSLASATASRRAGGLGRSEQRCDRRPYLVGLRAAEAVGAPQALAKATKSTATACSRIPDCQGRAVRISAPPGCCSSIAGSWREIVARWPLVTPLRNKLTPAETVPPGPGDLDLGQHAWILSKRPNAKATPTASGPSSGRRANSRVPHAPASCSVPGVPIASRLGG
jgi:hypothetical protein